MNKLQYACDISLVWAALRSITDIVCLMPGGDIDNFMTVTLRDACQRADRMLDNALDGLSKEDKQRVADMREATLADIVQEHGDELTAILFKQDLPDISDILNKGETIRCPECECQTKSQTSNGGNMSSTDKTTSALIVEYGETKYGICFASPAEAVLLRNGVLAESIQSGKATLIKAQNFEKGDAQHNWTKQEMGTNNVTTDNPWGFLAYKEKPSQKDVNDVSQTSEEENELPTGKAWGALIIEHEGTTYGLCFDRSVEEILQMGKSVPDFIQSGKTTLIKAQNFDGCRASHIWAAAEMGTSVTTRDNPWGLHAYKERTDEEVKEV